MTDLTLSTLSIGVILEVHGNRLGVTTAAGY
jgi:hypothetical protein